MPYTEDMVISRTKLANGATLTKLKPVEAAPTFEPTVKPGRGKLLVRVESGQTLALNASERYSFARERMAHHD